jgi:hypothetical protein
MFFPNHTAFSRPHNSLPADPSPGQLIAWPTHRRPIHRRRVLRAAVRPCGPPTMVLGQKPTRVRYVMTCIRQLTIGPTGLAQLFLGRSPAWAIWSDAPHPSMICAVADCNVHGRRDRRLWGHDKMVVTRRRQSEHRASGVGKLIRFVVTASHPMSRGPGDIVRHLVEVPIGHAVRRARIVRVSVLRATAAAKPRFCL